jgi:beta-lactamase regulating signal transducer with metallopeptidase domain
MSGFFISTTGWMIAEIPLTAAMLALYVILRRLTPVAADRFNFLRLSFLIVGILPFVPFSSLPLSWLVASGATDASDPVSVVSATAMRIQTAAATSPHIHTWLITTILIAYFFAVARSMVRFISSIYRLNQLAVNSTLIFEHEGIPVHSTEEKIPPATFGFFQPIIVIPKYTWNELSQRDLSLILDHEMAHIKRHDYAFNLIRNLVQSLLVFSPFIHVLSKAYMEEMELSCDAAVIRDRGGDGREYGGLLLDLASRAAPRPDLAFTGLFVSNSFISRRISAMKNSHLKSKNVLWIAALGVLAMMAGPTVNSWGINSAVDKLVSPSTASDENYWYQAKITFANNKGESSEGVMKLIDGQTANIEFGGIEIQVSTEKVPQGRKLKIVTIKKSSKETLQSSTVIVAEGEGAAVKSNSEDAKDDDLRGFSFKFSPVKNTAPKKSAQNGIIHSGDMVKLNFTNPTDIKEVIRVAAELSGKNVILPAGVEGKVSIVSESPVTKSDAFRALIAALDKLGIEAVENGKIVRLLKKSSH